MSTATPGYVFQCQAPPTPSPSSSTTRSPKPALSSLIAAPIPEKPAPTTMTSWSGAVVMLPRIVPSALVRRRTGRAAGLHATAVRDARHRPLHPGARGGLRQGGLHQPPANRRIEDTRVLGSRAVASGRGLGVRQ